MLGLGNTSRNKLSDCKLKDLMLSANLSFKINFKTQNNKHINMCTSFSICMASKPIFVCLKNAVDKQLQISPKSNGSFWPNLGCVVKLLSCIIWVVLNQPNCFINKSVYISFPINAKFSHKVIT